jgi:hypothetical protein
MTFIGAAHWAKPKLARIRREDLGRGCFVSDKSEEANLLKRSGEPGRTRTYNPLLKRQLLYHWATGPSNVIIFLLLTSGFYTDLAGIATEYKLSVWVQIGNSIADFSTMLRLKSSVKACKKARCAQARMATW